MNIFLIIVGSIIWYVIGCASFIYWWTNEYDFETSTVLVALCAGLIGPIAFLVGWGIHGSYQDKVLIKKRGE